MADRYTAQVDGPSIVLSDAQFSAQARIEPVLGNNVTHFRVAPTAGAAPVDVLLPPAGPAGLGQNGYSAGLPILFPFPNRVPNGRYSFEGKSYQLDLNEPGRPNHIHGLVSNLAWRTEARGADHRGAWHRAAIELNQHPHAARQYPFPNRLTVTTRLTNGVLQQEVEVQNTGSGALPMGYGVHPWFSAAEGTAPRPQTEIRVPAAEYWQLAGLVPTGRRIPVIQEPEKFDLRSWRALGANEYDDVFTGPERRHDGWIEAGIRYPDTGWEIAIEASPAFREWVLFAPNNRTVICIEPYTGTTNAINLQTQGVDAGLVVVQPGKVWTGAYRFQLRTLTAGR